MYLAPLCLSFGEGKFRVPFKNKVADEKRLLVQRGKFETMTIIRQGPSIIVVVIKKNFHTPTNLP
jgi:hypothetical protein